MIGHGLLLGQSLYSYLWDQKPPAIYVIYAIGELVFGFGNNAIYGINVVGTILTLIVIYFAGARYSGGQITGLVAGAFWVLLSQSLDLQANQPNSELFMNCCLFAIFAIFINSNRLNNKTLIFTGLLAALATLFKQITLPPICLLLASRLIFSDSQNRKRYFVEAIIILLIVALCWFFVATWLLEANSFTDFYEAVFIYNINYSRIGKGDIHHELKAYWDCLAQGLPIDRYVQGFLEIAATTGIAKIISRDPAFKLWLHWLVYLFGTLIAIAMAHHPFAHYFQLLIPFAAVGGAWSLNSLQNSFLIGLKTLFSYYKKSLTSFYCISMQICLTLMFFGPVFSDRIKELCSSPDDWSFRKYTSWFVVDKIMGEKLKSILYSFETIYILGDASTLYFYSGHFPTVCTFSSLYCNDYLMRADVCVKWSTRVMLELSNKRPDMIVVPFNTDKDTSSLLNDKEAREAIMNRQIITAWVNHNYYFYKTVEIEDKYIGWNRYFAIFLLPKSPLYSRLCNHPVHSKL